LSGSDIGERIADLRAIRVLKQNELAQMAGVSPSTLSLIESGRIAHPQVNTLRKLARALGVDPRELTDMSRRVEEPAASGKALAG